MAKFLITGATGYIGGDLLHALLQAHPDAEPRISCLVRNSDRGALIAKIYPKINLLYGSLDDEDVLSAAAEGADIVCHTADCDNIPSARALTTGLHRRALNGKAAVIIHTSGTGILTWADVRAGRFGAAAPESADEDVTYDDWDGVATVTSLPDDAWHRPVDKIILAAGTTTEAGERAGVLTAVVCPPTIAGTGRGLGNKRSAQWDGMAKCALQRGKAFYVGEGKNWWNWVHVKDLSDLYVTLIDAALDKIAGGSGGKATWGKEGYYFAEVAPFCWGDVAKTIGIEGKKLGLLKTDEVDKVSKEEADTLMEGGSAYWGLNSKCKAIRAKKLFGWEPKEKNLTSVISEIIEREALVLGLLKTYAQEAAGV